MERVRSAVSCLHDLGPRATLAGNGGDDVGQETPVQRHTLKKLCEMISRVRSSSENTFMNSCGGHAGSIHPRTNSVGKTSRGRQELANAKRKPRSRANNVTIHKCNMNSRPRQQHRNPVGTSNDKQQHRNPVGTSNDT